MFLTTLSLSYLKVNRFTFSPQVVRRVLIFPSPHLRLVFAIPAEPLQRHPKLQVT
jgi:hypothetical protein